MTAQVPEPARGEDPGRRSHTYSVGDVVAGRYRLKGFIGQGAMGAVFRAHNDTLDIDVALKVMRADRLGEDAADRLLREARAAAQLGDPAIVHVFDFGRTERDEPFIVMELLEGETLSELLARRKRLRAEKAVRLMLPVLHGLEAAHGKGVVHRDLKPENVFIARGTERRLQPKILDFGVAKVAAANTRLTRAGTLLGSPRYMSPEQARGEDVDRRADVWSAAVVLYELVAGHPPFDGKNERAVLCSILEDDPAPLDIAGPGDAELWRILSRALAKAPDRRWPSAREFGAALARWLLDRGVSNDIAGATIESTWLTEGTRSDYLSTAPPPRPAATRERAPTEAGELQRNELSARRGRALLITAAVALLAGALAGLAVVRGSSKPAEASPAAGVAAMPEPQSAAEFAPAEPARAAAAAARQTASAPHDAPPAEPSSTATPKSPPKARKPAREQLEARRASGGSMALKDPFR